MNAQEKLFDFLSSYPGLTPEDISTLMKAIPVEAVPAGTVLAEAGKPFQECYFVLQGCLRQFKMIDGTERTTAFFEESEACLMAQCYLSGAPSDQYIIAVEDCLLLKGTPESEQEMYDRIPAVREISRLMTEADLGKAQDALTRFVSMTPEERYLDLMKTRPKLIQRVPQRHIASFLGIAPESLSRLRRRLAERSTASR